MGKKRRRIEQDEDAPGGADAGGWEEYFDYIFPEDQGAKPNLKLLAMAKMWKKQKEEDRIPINEDNEATMQPQDPEADPDADDQDIRNESSSSSEDEEESD